LYFACGRPDVNPPTMMLWFILALMTAAAVFSVLWPLARRGPLRAGGDVAVYRDQLDEIERDRLAGLIGEQEAEAARVEVSRRLLAAADAVKREPAGGAQWRRRAAAIAALVLLPLGASSLYLLLGSPELPDQTQTEQRKAQSEERSVAELVGRVEAHLEHNPEDGRGWEVLGPVYMRLGRYDDAVKARRNAIRLLGPTPQREADLGEALTGAANGIVTVEAKQAFERTISLSPNDFRARYFIGLAAEQDGHSKEAAEIWHNLLASAPAEAPWIGFVRESLARVDPGAAARPPGPTADDLAAAGNLTSEQRETMIRGMVERLASRLRQDGSDVEGWLRLIRAYMVLGDRDSARAAANDARRSLVGEPDKARRMDELIKGLGIEG
jgi:cytochrome c-type biogenesis protein CcmH